MSEDQQRNNSKYYRSLARNMILVIVVFSLAPLILSSLIIMHHFNTAYKHKVRQQLGELVLKHSQNIDQFLFDRLADIRFLARTAPLERLMETDFLTKRLRVLREEFNGVYVDLGLIDENGIQISYAGPFNLLHANYKDADWFKRTLKSEDFVSDVFSGLRGTPHFIVAVRQNWEGRNWILRATIDFKAFNSLVDKIRIGSTGFAFILNRNGEFQTNSKPRVFINQAPFQNFLKAPLDHGKAKVVERIDKTGGNWIVSMSPLKNGQWLLCSQQTSTDAYAVLHQTRILVLMVCMVGGLIIIAVSFLVARRMVSRISMADQEKSDMNEKVIEAGRLASIGELAAGIAHEINNPVAIMVEEAGWIDDLLSDEDPNEQETRLELERAVRQIRTQGIRCKEITHKLLSFARKTDPKIHEVDLNETVNDVISLLKQKSRYANVRIQVELTDDLPEVIASPSELQQVLLNLVNNAMDALDASGGTVSVTTNLDHDHVTVTVADTGQGIPESILPRIFDPFFTTKPVGQGTGLGLSICFGIIKKLGGDIQVRSQPSQGTEFTVHLRASEEALAEMEAKRKTTPIKPIASDNLI